MPLEVSPASSVAMQIQAWLSRPPPDRAPPRRLRWDKASMQFVPCPPTPQSVTVPQSTEIPAVPLPTGPVAQPHWLPSMRRDKRRRRKRQNRGRRSLISPLMSTAIRSVTATASRLSVTLSSPPSSPSLLHNRLQAEALIHEAARNHATHAHAVQSPGPFVHPARRAMIQTASQHAHQISELDVDVNPNLINNFNFSNLRRRASRIRIPKLNRHAAPWLRGISR